jgi:hypothetical protein
MDVKGRPGQKIVPRTPLRRVLARKMDAQALNRMPCTFRLGVKNIDDVRVKVVDRTDREILEREQGPSPVAVWLCTSPRESQQATPRASSAAPAKRPTVNAAEVFSREPSSSATVADGQYTKVRLAPSSITAVRVSRFFIVGPFPWLFGPPRLSAWRMIAGAPSGAPANFGKSILWIGDHFAVMERRHSFLFPRHFPFFSLDTRLSSLLLSRLPQKMRLRSTIHRRANTLHF